MTDTIANVSIRQFRFNLRFNDKGIRIIGIRAAYRNVVADNAFDRWVGWCGRICGGTTVFRCVAGIGSSPPQDVNNTDAIASIRIGLRYLYIIFVRVGPVPEQTLMENKEAWNDVLVYLLRGIANNHN